MGDDDLLDKFGAAGAKLLGLIGPALAAWVLEKLGEAFETRPHEAVLEDVSRTAHPEFTEEERKAQLAALILAATSG